MAFSRLTHRFRESTKLVVVGITGHVDGEQLRVRNQVRHSFVGRERLARLDPKLRHAQMCAVCA